MTIVEEEGVVEAAPTIQAAPEISPEEQRRRDVLRDAAMALREYGYESGTAGMYAPKRRGLVPMSAGFCVLGAVGYALHADDEAWEPEPDVSEYDEAAAVISPLVSSEDIWIWSDAHDFYDREEAAQRIAERLEQLADGVPAETLNWSEVGEWRIVGRSWVESAS